jgi:DNA repair exonuclease SbcCD ATPase subunit
VDLEVSRRKEEHARNQAAALESELRSKNEALAAAQRELEASAAKKEEAVLYLQLQLNKARDAEDSREKEAAGTKKQLDALLAQVTHLQLQSEERESSLRTHKEMLAALQAKLEETESQYDSSRERGKELERNMGAVSVMKAEHESIVAALRRDLKMALEFRDIADKSTRESEQLNAKLEALGAKAAALTEQNGSLQAQLDEKTSTITRLRAEAANNERTHAMRTAMLATCEAQIESLKQELAMKDATTKEAVERVSVLQVFVVVSIHDMHAVTQVCSVAGPTGWRGESAGGACAGNESSRQAVRGAGGGPEEPPLSGAALGGGCTRGRPGSRQARKRQEECGSAHAIGRAGGGESHSRRQGEGAQRGDPERRAQ